MRRTAAFATSTIRTTLQASNTSKSGYLGLTHQHFRLHTTAHHNLPFSQSDLPDCVDDMTYENKARGVPVDQTRAKLMSHFADFKGDSYGDGWNELWKQSFMPWDRLLPSPALADTLINHRDLVGSSSITTADGGTRRKRALVPGCGRGVDVLLLQSFGYDTIGLEISQLAVDACEEFASANGNDDVYKVKDGNIGAGSRQFVNGDFYSDDWKEKVGLSKDTQFELIYDYTFFCAMQLSMRPAWAKRMSQLLAESPQANLICLEFPTTKLPGSGGPPFAAPSKAYMEHLSHPGEEVAYTAEGEVKLDPLSDSGPGALERVGHWHPNDTHAIGKDKDGNISDYISVWRHR